MARHNDHPTALVLALATLFTIIQMTAGCEEEATKPPGVSEPCATPVFFPPPATYTSPVSVEIRSATDGVTIRYTTDGSEPTDSADAYTEPIPIPTSRTLKARAWKQGLAPSDVATGLYRIEICTLAVTSPDGGESWAAGSSQTITWIASDCGEAVRIELLLNDAVCTTIADSTENDGAIVWAAYPCGDASSGYRVRVTDPARGVQDESNESFSILVPCRVTVTSPNGGEIWQEGTAHEITWRSGETCGDSVKIELLRPGLICSTIAGSTENDGTYTWTARGCAGETTDYTIRVTDLAGLTQDESDGGVTIPAILPCQMAVTSPVGGESWARDTEHTIGWSTTGECGGTASIELLLNGVPCMTIADETPNDGSYAWVAQPCDASEHGYGVRITDLLTHASIEGGQSFSIPPAASCQIMVLSPSGGEDWQEGREYEITWSSTEGCGSWVRIELLAEDSTCAVIDSHAPNSGARAWVAERCGGRPDGYRVRITDLDKDRSAESDRTFSIRPPSCQVTVLSPNGGERWGERGEYDITWDAPACGDSVRIELLCNGSVCSAPAEGTANDATFTWTAQGCCGAPCSYGVRITDRVSGASDESDRTFCIAPCDLFVTAPNGGEIWQEGTGHDITWSASDCGDSVRIELLWFGAVCSAIAEHAPNTGIYRWTAEQCQGSAAGYQVRVTDLRSGRTDDGNNMFSIPPAVPCELALTSPRGGESWQEGIEQRIQWSPSACDDAVRIELLLDDAVCATIASATEDDGEHAWVAQRCAAGGNGYRSEDGYKVRVTGLQSGVSDASEQTFSIPGPPCQLNLTSPNGGESWADGLAQTITWSSSGCGGTVKIELLRSGHVCSTITNSTPDDGSYLWPVQNCSGVEDGYAIRITDLSTGMHDEGDGLFSIPECGFAVTSPGGGESWTEGTEQEITWTLDPTCADSVRIELTCNGSVCATIADRTPNDGVQAWVAAACCSSDTPCFHRVRITDLDGGRYAESEQDFCICPSCQLTVTSPNGGEGWREGTACEITWDSAGSCGGQVKIELLLDGTRCADIAESTPNDGSYVWTVQSCSDRTAGFTIRITGLCGASDVSDQTFSIIACRPQVTTPNGGETLAPGSNYEITWNASACGSAVRIDLLLNETTCSTITSSTANDGTYLWTATPCASYGCVYKIRVTDLDSGKYDASDLPFCVCPLCRPTVTFPNGGESFPEGTELDIAWVPSTNCDDLVNIDLLRDGLVCSTIANGTPNDGLYRWTAQPCGIETNGYQIRISSFACNQSDLSDQMFTISVLPCELALASPNGGEIWVEETEHLISWTTAGHCGSWVKIELMRGASVCSTVTDRTANDGSHAWTAQNCSQIEEGYTIRITDLETSSSDQSDLTFSIPEPPCQLTVASPNGGENWPEGVEHNITWSSSHCGDSVKIELLLSGTPCSTISSSTPNDGSYAWIPQRCGTVTTGYAIRITDIRSGQVDQSDQTFAIPCSPCLLTLTSPNGGEQWREGTPQEILWTSLNCEAEVKIELLHEGDICSTIAASTPDDGSLTWTPARCSGIIDGYAIRISGLTCDQSDESDQAFSITPIPDLYYFAQDLRFCAGQQNVEIELYGRNSSPLRGYGISFCFDPDVFECLDISLQGTRGEGALYLEKLCAAGCARAGVIYSADCPPQVDAGDGPLLKVIASVKADAPLGPTYLDLINVDPAYNAMAPCSGSTIDPILQDGTVEICAGGTK